MGGGGIIKMRKKLFYTFIIGVIFGIVISRTAFKIYRYFVLKEVYKKDPYIKYILKAEEYKNKGQMNKSIEEYEKALKYKPYDINIQENLAELYVGTGMYGKAIELYKERADRNDPFALYEIGKIYWKMGRMKESLEYLEKSAELGNILAKIELEKIKNKIKESLRK